MKNEEIKKHYQLLYARHGQSEKAVQYSDKYTQWARFASLAQFIRKDCSILDYGCGLGHFLEFMKKNNYVGNYCGVDIVKEFISSCRERFEGDKQADFICLDNNYELPLNFDFIVASGVFNNKRKQNEEFMLETVTKMFKACRIGIALNAMSTYVDYEEDNLFYYSPEKLLSFVKTTLGGYPILNHSYKLKSDAFPHDYTLTVFKYPQLHEFNS